AAPPGDRTLRADRRRRSRARLVGTRAAAARAPAHRLRGTGAPALPQLYPRRDAEARTEAEPALGRRARPGPARQARALAAPAGRQALGRPAGAAGADARARQAPRAAAARRAGRLARPARPPRVPPVADGGRRGRRADRRPLVAHR